MKRGDPAGKDTFGKVIIAGNGRWSLLVAQGGFPAKFCSSLG